MEETWQSETFAKLCYFGCIRTPENRLKTLVIHLRSHHSLLELTPPNCSQHLGLADLLQTYLIRQYFIKNIYIQFTSISHLCSPLWLRSVSWPFPIELRSALLLWLQIYLTFSSLKNRPTFSYPLRLLWEGQMFSFALWSKHLGIRVDLQTLSKNTMKVLLGTLAFGHENWSCWVLTQKPGSWKWVLLVEPSVDKQLLWGHGWRSSRKLPLGFRFIAVLGKYMLHPERNVPSTWLASSYLLAYIFIIVSLWRIHISFPHA